MQNYTVDKLITNAYCASFMIKRIPMPCFSINIHMIYYKVNIIRKLVVYGITSTRHVPPDLRRGPTVRRAERNVAVPPTFWHSRVSTPPTRTGSLQSVPLLMLLLKETRSEFATVPAEREQVLGNYYALSHEAGLFCTAGETPEVLLCKQARHRRRVFTSTASHSPYRCRWAPG